MARRTIGVDARLLVARRPQCSHNRGMHWRVILALGVLAAAMLPLSAACSLESDSKFGNPSGLSHANLPSPAAAEGGAAPSTGSLCDGGGPVDGGPCQISFAKDIWPMMSAAGVWACADSNCHGGTALNPFINDAPSAYANLVAYKIGGKAYINPCSTDPKQSTFVCNLQGTCGQQAMPIPDNTKNRPLAIATDIGKVNTWLQCGAPFN